MKTSLSRRVDPQKNVMNPSILQAVRPRKKYPIAFDNVVKNIPEIILGMALESSW